MLITLMRFVIYFIVCMFTVTSAYAQTQEKGFISKNTNDLALSIGLTQGTRWALLIGITNYPSSQTFDIQPLKSPVKDVKAINEFLIDPQKGGFDTQCVSILMDGEATKRNILMTFNDIAKRATSKDMVIIYFSGHGYRPNDDGTTYLIPYDYDLEDCETTCINFDDLSKKIQRMDASKIIVILDACHSGGVKPKGAKSVQEYTGIVQKYSEAFQRAEGRYLFLSSDEKEVSWETEEGGIFTQFLLDGLNGKADSDKDGIVTFSEVALYVENNVPEYTRSKYPKIQTPVRRGDLGGQVRGDIPLAINIHEVNRIKQEDIRKKRYEVIISGNMNREIREFSLGMIKTIYDKSINDQALTELELSFSVDIDAFLTGKITVDEYVLRAQIFYEKITGKRVKATQIRESEVNAEVKKISPAVILAGNLPINTKVYVNDTPVNLPHQIPAGTYAIRLEREGFQPIEISQSLNSSQNLTLQPRWVPLKNSKSVPPIGMFVSYVFPEKWEGRELDSTFGYGITGTILEILSSHLKAEINVEYYNLRNTYSYSEGIDESGNYYPGSDEKLNRKVFPLNGTLKFYPIHGNISPFIGIGPSIILSTSKWDIDYTDGTSSNFTDDKISIGGSFTIGTDVYIGTKIRFASGLKYSIMTKNMGSLQIIASMMFRFW